MIKQIRTTRRIKKGNRRNGRVHASVVKRRQTVSAKRAKQAFNALKVAQEILDNNRTIVVYGNKIGVVYPDRDEAIYAPIESQKIISEFHEMFHIAKKCTLLCDPLRKKLQELLFICRPIGLTHSRMHEAGE